MFCICHSHNRHILDCMIHWYLKTCPKWIDWFHGIQILLPYNSIIFISLGMHRKCWYLNIPQRSMSIPGKQKHHTDIDLDLMIIRFFLFVRFKTSPSLGIKWSMDISNIGKKDYLISSFYGVTWVYQGSKSTIAILHWI